ncbi:ATP-dependent RNA helicase dbp9 [Coniosporium apollinis CBS 100218]|uniref:RNA helicase n=1 Tax=Coniosporium apollinis (strain CBS 100218) TaxID=1168221 RepID=R7YVE5_CONA1|nr:ATP-dependent RNA helicase dbp9 [Coniosporium apollinis CBS 100218]EON65606.1 ATP-dependent RNA helicase dbp9 [Coniosporium apollinis CBS 100218]
MKRKLNEHDVPEAVTAAPVKPTIPSFEDLGLDPRLLQGIIREKWSTPTPVQAKAIPLAREGKDILARSKTGSGKTAAYLLPILHSILERKSSPSYTKCTAALILVPTRELAAQVTKAADSFTAFCGQAIRTENLTRKEDDKVQRARLADFPDVVVATPGRTIVNLNSGALKLDGLSHLVIDEADLVLSYGYDEDLENISRALSKGVQTFLVSATLRTELDTLKGLFCKDPVLLELDEEEKGTGGVSQYVIKCAEDEKFLLIYAIFMLKLIKGKCIVFVGDIDRCYRLKLFLEQFGIKSCVLNSELPVSSRLHVVEEFNRNVYDIIIATDEHEVLGDEGKGKKRKSKEKQDEDEGEDEQKIPITAEGSRKAAKRDKDYGISRGIDFKRVSTILNFDLPSSSKSYTHRIGRTGRAGQTGTAISFIIPKDKFRKHKPTSIPSAEHDEEVLAKIIKSQEKKGNKVLPFQFDMARLEGFRYRMADALRHVTRIAVREARTRELRNELLKSEKLKRHFEENPEELAHLRHDQESHVVRTQPHLKHVPDYLLPGGRQKVAEDVGFVGFAKDERSGNRIRKARMQNRMREKGRKVSTKRADPLKTFNAKGRG